MAWAKALHFKVPARARWASSRDWALQTLVAALYFFSGKLGLLVASDHFQAGPISPAAGVSVAAILILGYRIWPGLLAGAFLLNLAGLGTAGHNSWLIAAVALCMACGETLQALAAGWLAENYAQGSNAFSHPRNTAIFVALAAVAASTISATSNLVTVLVAGLATWRQVSEWWPSQWLGDIVGVILLTPLILVWTRGGVPPLSSRRLAEPAALISLLMLTCALVFGGWLPNGFRGLALSFIIIPTLLWTAFRFGELGTVTANFAFACLALAGTLRGHGPFIVSDRYTSLLLLQNFIAAMTIMSLLLAAEVSQRRRIDAGLRASEQRYRDFFEFNPLPMWVFDYDTLHFLAVNQAAVRHYGYSRDEFLALTIADIRPPEDVPAFIDMLQRARRGLEIPSQHRHRKKDGSLIDVEISRYNLLLDGKEAAMVLIKDITERKRAETALRESERRLRLALAASRMGIWTMELQGPRRIVSSPELDVIFGLKPGEFDGSEETLFSLIHPDDHSMVRASMAQAIRSEGEYEIEFRILPRDRLQGWVLARGCSCFDEHGKPTRLIGVVFDISARKVDEGEILRLSLELERRVAERTAELEAINIELESFSFSVSHDLRAPLRSIRGFSEVLRDHYGEKLDARGRDFLKRACESCHQMDLLIEDLLKLSRIGRAGLHLRSIDLSAIAQSIVDELRAAEPKRSVKFTLPSGLKAWGDERLVRIALENLLRNAWKFTANQPRAKIEFGQIPSPPRAFFVRDNGAGFDMVYAARLFGVFQRLHSAAEFPGTGVGLATVQRILNRHGGRIWAEAAVDQGATFYFTLPRNGNGKTIPDDCATNDTGTIVQVRATA